MKKILLLILSVSVLQSSRAQGLYNQKAADTLSTVGTAAVVQPGDFSIAVIPDSQYYLAQAQLGGNFDMLKAQIDWITKNQKKENIAYVAQMGDITEHGDNPATARSEWYLAQKAYYKLESPVSIPYGMAVGNHDQYPSQYPVKGTTNGYNKYFGVSHFEGRPYYGGHYGNNNDSHYDLFSAGGKDFIVVFLEYDQFNEDQDNMYNWANGILKKYADRKGIVVSHSIMHFNPVAGSNTPQGEFDLQGKAIYAHLKDCPNLFMMLCGHVGDNGEGYRTDTFDGHTVKTFLSDYQSRANGGHGLMRLYKFSVKKNELSVRTFSPYTNEEETDGDSKFTVSLFN
ncbi:metallophosphoesterase [Mucilaginibacter ginkgonis]|uniref:Metallophosphoesterase n=1 Tax=Mucilaginibacter ginkgonis TaxID=2682091 RepID=A0A6I4I1H6_9SPHI|nr:metallophosphoesterase [Mucilaginibacter ginkgonis]QQL48986.1 metallophosphoesterase [Mucilaginibacter ginkgonis]